jgi:hypothetical protein
VPRLRRSDLGTLAAGVACFAGVALVVGAAHAQGHAAGSPLTPPGAWRPTLYVALIGALVTYAAGCWASSQARASVAVVGAVAVGVQLVPLAGPLLLSTDATSYTTYGRAHEPYHLQDGWATPSVYGPLWTFVSEPVARLGRPELGFRILAATCVLGITAGAAALAANPAAAVVFVGWNPLLALHGAGGGHNDALMMALVVLALLFARGGRAGLAGAAWAASIWIKWVSIVLWAAWLLFRWRRRESLGLSGFAAVTAVLTAAAFARFGSDWLKLFDTASNEARRTSSIGLLGWLGHLGVPHREAVAVAMLAVVAVVAGLLFAAWRRRLALGIGSSLLALAQGRLNPWFGMWGVSLAGADEDVWGRVLAVSLTALLLSDVLPR